VRIDAYRTIPASDSGVEAAVRATATPLVIWGAVAGSGAAADVLVGGVITSALGWRSVLFVNVPIGIGAIVTRTFISESRGDLARRSFDLPGAVTVVAGLSALVYFLVRTTTIGWPPGPSPSWQPRPPC
jgi:2-keto-3-deoxy-galactonokinase